MSEDVRFAHTSDMFRSRETLYKVVKHMLCFYLQTILVSLGGFNDGPLKYYYI